MVKPKELRVYVEGGGDATALKAACREGFTKFFDKAGLKGHMPRIIACGDRRNAYESFCTAIANGQRAFLLVDSEDPVTTQPAGINSTVTDRKQWQPWTHLKQRDNWEKPTNSSDTDCHLMVQIMESWFLADHASLEAFFGQGFHTASLPSTSLQIEALAKTQIYHALGKASAKCKTKSKYGKGEHSFKLLAAISAEKVCQSSPWALRLIESLKTEMGVG